MKRKLLLAALCVVGALGFKANAQSWTGNAPAEGTFFLYNVGAGKFINNGDPNENWGTNAYLQAGFGLDFTLVANGDAYYLDSNVSNGGDSHYLATSTWCDGGPTAWTFTAVAGEGNTYTISNGGSYLVANDDLNDVVYGNSTNNNKSWWKLVSLDDFKTAMQAKTYSSTDPMDVSVFIQGRSFNRNDGRNNTWKKTNSGGNFVWLGSCDVNLGTQSGYTVKYVGNEAWNNTFNVSQAITGLPEGTYEVQCSGFGTNGTTYIYGNNTSQALQTDNTTSYGNSKEAKWKAIHEDNAFAGQSTGTFVVGDGNLTLGVKRETNKSGDWCVYDEFRLYYYGLDLSEFAAALTTSVEAANATNGTIPTGAYNAIQAVVTEYNKTYTSAAGYTEAINAINEAVATYAASAIVANYARYNKVKNAVKAISSTIDISDGETKANAATTRAALDEAVVSVRTALANYLATVTLGQGQTIDLTDALIDNAAPGESGNTEYWTNSGTPSLQYQLFEYYRVSGGTTKQTIATTLPVGSYRLTATAFTRTGYEAKLNAGQANINIVTVDRNTVNDRNQGNNWIAQGHGVTNLVFSLEEATSNLEIGLTAYDSSTEDNWMCWRSFQLVYGDVFEPYTLVEGKMNANVSAAQTQAATTFEAAKTVDNYNALTAAITAAQASKDAYTKLGAAVTKLDAALAAATSATASTDDYTAIKTAYNNGTIADADIPAQVKAAYDAVIPVIKSQTAEEADFTFAIQNQSFEYGDMTGWTATASNDTGVRATSNATYAAAGSDGDYLFNTWSQGVPVTQMVTDIPNGQYTLTASVSSDGATIYLIANGAYDEGTETGGEYPSSDTFQDASFTFLVKDGTATIGAVGGADGTAGEHKEYVAEGYWWYKADNFRLVKNRNLTAEEEAVVPTAIALYNGEEEVTEDIALDATTSTVTLTPSYTPAEATEGYIAWTTSDATVATVSDGVVTAVSSGTVTITATSTLAPSVSATATINVEFPESTVPAYANNDATRTVYNYGPNLIKNGSFEYPDNFYGWTSGAGAKLTSSNFSIQTTGAYDGGNYLKASADKGQTDAGSIYTSWPVEAGKKYIFSYQMKNSSAVNNDDYIRTSLSATTAEDATSYSNDFKAVSCGTDWTELSYEFTVPEGKNYLVFSARWLKSSKSFDNFYLCEVLDEPTTVGNVDYATAAIPTANIGTGAFQYSQDAIDAANALVQGTATVAEVEAAYNALVTLNAPVEGQLYNVVNITSGYAYANKALTFQSASDADLNANTTTMGWLEEPGSIYPQGVKFTAVDGTLNGYTLSYTRADGNVVYVSTGSKSGLGTDNNQLRPTTDATKALTFVVTSVGDNHWYLNNTVTGNNVGATSGQAGFYTAGGANKDLKIQEAVNNEVSLNIKAENQYGTLILPFDAEIPTSVKAYTVTGTSGEWMTISEAEKFEANTPYFVEAVDGVNETLAGIGSAYTDDTYTGGLLTGVYESTLAPVNSYVLQKINDEVAFYQVDEGAQPTVGANRAYLSENAGANVRALFFPAGEATGIEAIGVLTSGNYDAIYTAGGAKVNSLQKGLNIVVKDGKSYKIFVK